jgi:hypothetical protein
MVKSIAELEEEESERMVLCYFGEKRGREILKEIDEELKQLVYGTNCFFCISIIFIVIK